MGDLSPWFILLVVIQVLVFVFLVLLMFRLVKVIKAQNNGKVLPPDLGASLRRLFSRGKK